MFSWAFPSKAQDYSIVVAQILAQLITSNLRVPGITHEPLGVVSIVSGSESIRTFARNLLNSEAIPIIEAKCSPHR